MNVNNIVSVILYAAEQMCKEQPDSDMGCSLGMREHVLAWVKAVRSGDQAEVNRTFEIIKPAVFDGTKCALNRESILSAYFDAVNVARSQRRQEKTLNHCLGIH
jgi:hypothetical protein